MSMDHYHKTCTAVVYLATILHLNVFLVGTIFTSEIIKHKNAITIHLSQSSFWKSHCEHGSEPAVQG